MLHNVNRQDDYNDYLRFQASKAQQEELRRMLQTHRNLRVGWFCQRFQPVVELMHDRSRALCLGARFGEECEALLSLGFKDVVGIDIEPYPPFVQAGDMNRCDYAPNSFDLVYTNAIDHCWDIDDFVRNLLRVVTPTGRLMLHTYHGEAEPFETYAWDSAADVAQLFAGCSVVVDQPMRMFCGLDHEFVFEKPTNVTGG